MATNQARFVRNIYGAPGPYIVPGAFQAGATQAVKMGEILELTGDSSTKWVPWDSDYNADANIAIAAEEIKSGDRAGYYQIIVPRPGDVFTFELASASNPSLGASLYYSSSEKFTTSGTYPVAAVCGWHHYPPLQTHLTAEPSTDMGTTIKSTSWVEVTFLQDVSYFDALHPLT